MGLAGTGGSVVVQPLLSSEDKALTAGVAE